MKTIRFRTRVASLLSAIVLVFQISPALAFGLQGASQNHQSFEVTFTKWITGVTPSGTLLMASPAVMPPVILPGKYLIEK